MLFFCSSLAVLWFFCCVLLQMCQNCSFFQYFVLVVFVLLFGFGRFSVRWAPCLFLFFLLLFYFVFILLFCSCRLSCVCCFGSACEQNAVCPAILFFFSGVMVFQNMFSILLLHLVILLCFLASCFLKLECLLCCLSVQRNTLDSLLACILFHMLFIFLVFVLSLDFCWFVCPYQETNPKTWNSDKRAQKQKCNIYILVAQFALT